MPTARYKAFQLGVGFGKNNLSSTHKNNFFVEGKFYFGESLNALARFQRGSISYNSSDYFGKNNAISFGVAWDF